MWRCAISASRSSSFVVAVVMPTRPSTCEQRLLAAVLPFPPPGLPPRLAAPLQSPCPLDFMHGRVNFRMRGAAGPKQVLERHGQMPPNRPAAARGTYVGRSVKVP